MARLLEADTTIAVILGARDWTKAGLPEAPSFLRSATQLHSYLTAVAPRGLGLQPRFVLSLFDDTSPANAQVLWIRDQISSLITERRNTQRPIKDVLIYYIGHGECKDGRRLHLLVRHTSRDMVLQSSIPAEDLAYALRVSAPQQRRIVILDCCFSEAAVESFVSMGTLSETIAAVALDDFSSDVGPPERGTIVFCSSPRGR